MQPPLTEPLMPPASETAIFEPRGRGEEPTVRITVATTTVRPSVRQRSTSERMSSTAAIVPAAGRVRIHSWRE